MPTTDPNGLVPLHNAEALHAGGERLLVFQDVPLADRAMSLGFTATATDGTAPQSVDWKPAARFDEVIILYSNGDIPGMGFACDTLRHLRGANAKRLVALCPVGTGLKNGETLQDLLFATDDTTPLTEAIARAVENTKAIAEDVAAEALEVPALAGSPVLVQLADVRPESVQWLWPGRIALGKLTLIAGDPGLGKSFLTLDIAARVTRGTPWPDDRGTPNAAGGVVLLGAEDGLADTIRPRLDAAGADVSRIVALQAVKVHDTETGAESSVPFCITADLPALEQAIKRTTGCRLVVIDPITAYLGAVDSYKNAEIRAALAPLANLAEQYNVAVVAVTHLRKSDGPAVYRAMGSLAFTAAARSVWAITKDKDDPTRRLMLPVKNNLGADVMGLAYRIQATSDPGDVPVVAWEPNPVELSADDALSQDSDRTERDDAADFLREVLAAGSVKAKEVFKQAREAGISERTLRRAQRALGVKPTRAGYGGGGSWVWGLPAGHRCPPATPADPHTQSVAIFEERGHLWANDSKNGGESSAKDTECAIHGHPLDVDTSGGDPAVSDGGAAEHGCLDDENPPDEWVEL